MDCEGELELISGGLQEDISVVTYLRKSPQTMLARRKRSERMGSSPGARRPRHQQGTAGFSLSCSGRGEPPDCFLSESSSSNDVDLDRELDVFLGDVEEGDVGPAKGRGQLGEG